MNKNELTQLIDKSPLLTADKEIIKSLFINLDVEEVSEEIVQNVYAQVLVASNVYLESIGAADPNSVEEKAIVQEFETEMKDIEDTFKEDMKLANDATEMLTKAASDIDAQEEQQKIIDLQAKIQGM